MKSLVHHVPSGLTLDFAELDFGGLEQVAVIRAWQERGHHVLHRGEFLCDFHRDREHGAVYLRQYGETQIIAAHYAGFRHQITHYGVTSEHHYQVEYTERAGQDVGFEVRREVALATKVRSDAVVYGPKVSMGIEVQRSHLTAPAAKARTTKARRAGIEPVWFSDSRADPSWFGHVPGVKMNPDTSWAALPGQRTVTVVSGVRLLRARRCRDIYNSRCPRRSRGCNEWHPDHEPLPLLVDDLIEQVPVAELIPVLYRTLSGREQVLIFSAADKGRYEAMTGMSATLPLAGQYREPLRRVDRIDCTADAGALIASPRDALVEQDELVLFDLPEPSPKRDASRWMR